MTHPTLLRLVLGLSLILSPISVCAGSSDEMTLRNVSHAEREKIDRLVDRAALESQRRAIEQIETLLTRYRNTDREEMLLAKLGDLRQQRAQIEFRLGQHSRDESSYRRSLSEAIRTFDEVLRRFPESEQVPRVLSWRARAHADLTAHALAEKDFVRLIQEYPESPESESARMALAGYAAERGDHARALAVLTPLGSRPESPFHPFALHQMAWAAFNREDIPSAIDYARRNVEALRHRSQENRLSSSDEALLENTLLDVATFEADRVEKMATPPSAQEIFETFQSLSPGSRMPAMALRLAKLLRAHDQSRLLSQWSALAWQHLPEAGASAEIDLLLREYAHGRRDFVTLLAPLPERARSSENSAFEGHRRLYSKVAAELHELLSRNSGVSVEKSKPWIERLGAAYERFLEITPASDPRNLQARLNLAEAFVALKELDRAIPLYRAIVESQEWSNAAVIRSSLGSIRSRLERLKQEGVMPEKITLAASDQELDSDPRILELLTWIDMHLSHDKSREFITMLRFERAKILYRLGRRSESHLALESIIDAAPDSTDAAGALALLLDSEFLSGDLPSLKERIGELQRRRALSSNASAAQTITQATLRLDVLLMNHTADPGNARLARDRLLSREDAPREVRDAALIDRARELDLNGNPAEALEILQKASNPGSRASALLLLAYASENWTALSEILRTQCDPKTPLCAQFSQWMRSRRKSRTTTLVAELRRISKTSGTERLLSVLPLLTHQKKLGYRDRNLLIRLSSKGWNDLLPLLQWEVLAPAIEGLEAALQSSREQIRRQSPLSGTQKSEAHLVHRMDVIREFENTVRAALQIPVFEIQVTALEQHAAAMRDFGEDLDRIENLPAAVRSEIEGRASELRQIADQRSSALAQSVAAGEAFIAGNPQLTTTMPISRARKRWFFENAASLSETQQALWLGWILWNSGAKHAASSEWEKAKPTVTAANQ